MPLIYTDHKPPQALEHELRELWRRIDALVMAGARITPAGTAATASGGVAGIPAANVEPSYARMFAMMGG